MVMVGYNSVMERGWMLMCPVGSVMAAPYPFTAALLAGELDKVNDFLAQDVVLSSPILARYRFRGRNEVLAVLADVHQILVEPSVLAEFGERKERLVVTGGRIMAKDIEIASLLRFDESGRIREIKILARPLPGVAALIAGLGPRIARRRSTVRAVLMAVMARPFAVLAPILERAAERIVGTARGGGVVRH